MANVIIRVKTFFLLKTLGMQDLTTKLKATGPSRDISAIVRCVEVHLPDTYTSYAQLVGWVGAALGPNTHSHT